MEKLERLEGKGITMKLKEKASRPYEDSLDERLTDPNYAIRYLNSILEENDSDLLLLGLRDVARAYGFTYMAENGL